MLEGFVMATYAFVYVSLYQQAFDTVVQQLWCNSERSGLLSKWYIHILSTTFEYVITFCPLMIFVTRVEHSVLS